MVMNDRFKFRVWFYDGKDFSTGEWVSLEYALKECCVEVYGTQLVPSDECSIIVECTGLKDSEGTWIYEGDIIKIETLDYDVVFCSGAFKLIRRASMFEEVVDMWVHEVRGGCHCASEDSRISGTKIIGNIYENPELIKGENYE